MQSLVNNLPIPELIAGTNDLMERLGYGPTTMRHFRQCWNALKNHALREGHEYLTLELGEALLLEKYGIGLYDSNLSSFKQVTRRAVMLLLEFQVSGTIAKHMPMRVHNFPEQFMDIAMKYLKSLSSEKNLKAGTIRNHELAVESFLLFCHNRKINRLEDVTTNLVNDYLKTFAGCAKSYASSRIGIMRAFFDYAREANPAIQRFTFPGVTMYKDRKVPEYYKDEEIGRLLAAVDRANPRGKRDYAMLLTGARYGLRVCDIKNLKLDDIDFVANKINIVQLKTDKPLELDLLPDVGWAIIDYLKNGRPTTTSRNVFVRHVVPYESFGTYDNLAYLIGRYATTAGLDYGSHKNSFHMLRYGLASELLRQNVSLTTISGILGHSELNVTTHYTKIDVPQLKVCALEVPR